VRATAPPLRVLERELVVFGRLWRSVAIAGVLGPLLYLGALGVGLGGLVDERTGLVDGLRYLEFVTPGLVAATAMQSAAGAALWDVMGGTTWQRSFHAMVATPISPADVFAGFVTWICVRTGLAAAAFLAVAAALGGVPSAWGVLALPAAVMTAAGFAAPLAAFAATQTRDVAFPLVQRLVVMPLFLFSGTFYPVDQLPGWLQPVAVASPLWHGVELCRAATTGRGSPALAGSVLVLLACVAAGAWWGRRTFTAALAP
jgi:lipooligosaccharide transport system permease protein